MTEHYKLVYSPGLKHYMPETVAQQLETHEEE